MNAEFEISYDRLNISKSPDKLQKAELKADDCSDTTRVTVAIKAYIKLRSEIGILAKLEHKNVIKFFGAVTEDDKNILVMEYAPDGNLFDYLKEQKKRLSVDHSLEWAKHCSNAVAYLHSKDIIHWDIKSPNFLLSADFTEQSVHVLKLCDFGISHRVKILATSTSATIGGLSCRWASPEVIDNPIYHAYKSDIYSLAVVIWELFTGGIPYQDLKDYQIPLQIMNGKTPNIESIQSQGVCTILKMCWRREQCDRPSATCIVERLIGITDNDVEPDSAQPHDSLREDLLEGVGSLLYKLSTGQTHESVRPMVQSFTPRNSLPRSPRRIITESELQELTHHFGKHWKGFGSILGYKQTEVDVFDINNKTNVKEAMYEMLHSWKSKCGNEATVGNLVNHLDNFEHINPGDYQFLIDDSTKD